MTTKYKNVQLKHVGQVDSTAKCKNCEWKQALQAAAGANKHVKETGHEVVVFKTSAYSLTPKEE